MDATTEHDSLTALIAHIEETHHAFTRTQLEFIEGVFKRLPDASRLAAVRQCCAELQADLLPHLMKEERILFPYICALEEGRAPNAPFGTVANPIRMMNMEHTKVKELLETLRTLTGHYANASACGAELLAALAALDEDLVRHIHVEDSALFPRAIALENSMK